MIIYAAGIDWNEIIVFNSYSYKTCILYICKKNTQENEGKTMQLESIIIGKSHYKSDQHPDLIIYIKV